MTGNIEKIDQETFESLLPWYVSGQLNSQEHQSVREFLKENPEFASQVEIAAEEQQETILSNEALGSPSPAALDRLMQDIEAETKASPLAWLNDLFDPFWDMLGNMRPVAAMAAAAVIMIQAVSIGVLVSKNTEQEKRYITATKGDSKSSEKGSFVFIQFTKTASVQNMTTLLDALDAELVEGPQDNGIYKVRISASKLTESDRDKIIAKLAGRTEIVKQVFPAN